MWILLLCIHLELFAKVLPCYLTSSELHTRNQIIFKRIVDEELKDVNGTPEELAAHLNSRINILSRKLWERGFAPKAYATPAPQPGCPLSYAQFLLWEGASNRHKLVKTTFYIYAWPSEEFALTYESNSYRYGSDIHSHPMTCAFTVLQGILYQKNFKFQGIVQQRKIVNLINEEVFAPGEGSLDDLGSPFIHQLYSKGGKNTPCLSLHSYGLSTEAEVRSCYYKSAKEHTYYQN